MASSDVEIKTEPVDEDYSAIKEEELNIPFTWIGGDHIYCKNEPGIVSISGLRNSLNLLIPKEEPLEVEQPEASNFPKDGGPSANFGSERIPKHEPTAYTDDDDEPLLGFDDNLKPVTERYYNLLNSSVDHNYESPIETGNNNVNPSPSDPEFHCSSCKRYFISKKELHFHKCLRHRDDNVCPKCGEVFRSQTILRVHLEVHDRRERYLNLHKKEKKSPPLRRHLPKLPVKSSESDRMLFGCNECDMMFATPQKLNNHARAHNGCKYICNKCGKFFRYLAVMKNHLRRKACANVNVDNIIRESMRISDDDYLVEGMRETRNSSCDISKAIIMGPSDVGANVIIDNDGNQFVIKEENFSPESLPKETEVIKTEPIVPKEEDQSDTDTSDDFTDRLLQELIDRKSRSIAKERTITFETASSFMKKLPEQHAKCEPDLKRLSTTVEKTKSSPDNCLLPKLDTPKQTKTSVLTLNATTTVELLDPRKSCANVTDVSPGTIDKRKYIFKRNIMPEHNNPNLPITGVLQSITSFIKKFPEQSAKFQSVFALLSASAEKRKYVCEANNNSAAPMAGVFRTVSSSIKEFPEKRAKFQKVLEVLPPGEAKIKPKNELGVLPQLNNPALPKACALQSVSTSTKELQAQCPKPQSSLKVLPTMAECSKPQNNLKILPTIAECSKPENVLKVLPTMAECSKPQNGLKVLPTTAEEEKTISSSSSLEKVAPTGCVLQKVSPSIKELPDEHASKCQSVLEVLPITIEKEKNTSESNQQRNDPAVVLHPVTPLASKLPDEKGTKLPVKRKDTKLSDEKGTKLPVKRKGTSEEPLATKLPKEKGKKLPVKRKDLSEEGLRKLLFKKHKPKPLKPTKLQPTNVSQNTQKSPIPQTFIPADIMQKYRDDKKPIYSTQHTARTKQTLETLAEQCRLDEAKIKFSHQTPKAFHFDTPTLFRYKDKFIETYHRWHPLTHDLHQAAVHAKNKVKAPVLGGDLKENCLKKLQEEAKDTQQIMVTTSFPIFPPTQKPATDRPQDPLDFEEVIMLNTVACTTINGVPAAIEVRHEPAVHPKIITSFEAEEIREDSAPHEDECKIKEVETAMEPIKVTENCKKKCQNSSTVPVDESSQNPMSTLETPASKKICIKTEKVSPVSTSETINQKIKKPKGTYKIESPLDLPKEKIEFIESLRERYEKAKQLKLKTENGDESSQQSTSSFEAPPKIYFSVLEYTDPIPGPFQIEDQSFHYLWCCTMCTRRYVNRSAFVSHLKQNHNKQDSDLAKELYELRPEPVTLTNASDNSFCDMCNVNLGDPELLQKHLKELHKEKKKKTNPKFKCSSCGKYCATYSGLTTHINSNCGQEPQYGCTVCGKSFFTKSTLNLHRSIHTGELPHKCGHCDKRFRTRGQVTVHTRTHTGERPFVCKVCDRRFTHRETLISHLSRHIDMKRFRCDGCQRRFACISGLTTHRSANKTTCGMYKLNSRSVGVRVRVVKGNVLFEPQSKFNPYARAEKVVESESTSIEQNVDQLDMKDDLDVLKTIESIVMENTS